MKITGRTFIVTGGASGLGLATATLLTERDANVAVLDLREGAWDPGFIKSGRLLFVTTDVTSSSSISAALSSVHSWIELTKKPLGGIVCCAGIGAGQRMLLKQPPDTTNSTVKMVDMKIFDRVLAINLRGTVDIIRQTLPHLALNDPEGDDEERGVIIVVSSVAAYEGQVGQLAYSASKGAVASLVLPLAREVGRAAGIRVMGIAPGLFETGMTSRPPPRSKKSTQGVETPDPNQVAQRKMQAGSVNPNMVEYPSRMGKPEEFASLVKEVVENPMLNGQVIRLDGALRMPSRL